jgi:hypothetical protein
MNQINRDGTGSSARRQANVNQMESQQSSSRPPAGRGNYHGQSSQTNRNYPSRNNQRPANGNNQSNQGRNMAQATFPNTIPVAHWPPPAHSAQSSPGPHNTTVTSANNRSTLAFIPSPARVNQLSMISETSDTGVSMLSIHAIEVHANEMTSEPEKSIRKVYAFLPDSKACMQSSTQDDTVHIHTLTVESNSGTSSSITGKRTSAPQIEIDDDDSDDEEERAAAEQHERMFNNIRVFKDTLEGTVECIQEDEDVQKGFPVRIIDLGHTRDCVYHTMHYAATRNCLTDEQLRMAKSSQISVWNNILMGTGNNLLCSDSGKTLLMKLAEAINADAPTDSGEKVQFACNRHTTFLTQETQTTLAQIVAYAYVLQKNVRLLMGGRFFDIFMKTEQQDIQNAPDDWIMLYVRKEPHQAHAHMYWIPNISSFSHLTTKLFANYYTWTNTCEWQSGTYHGYQWDAFEIRTFGYPKSSFRSLDSLAIKACSEIWHELAAITIEGIEIDRFKGDELVNMTDKRIRFTTPVCYSDCIFQDRKSVV